MKDLLLGVFHSWDKLATMDVRIQEHESHLSYTKRLIKKTTQTPDRSHFKFRLQNLHSNSEKPHAKTLDVIIAEKKQTFRSLFMDGIRLSQCYRATTKR